MADQGRIPLFPLGTVVYPGGVLPLHVFEERYRLLVRTLVAGPEEARGFGVVAIREGRETGVDGVHALHEVGTAVSLEAASELPDGRWEIATVGRRRFRLLSLDSSLPYLQADVQWLPELPGDPAEASVLAQAAARRFVTYREALRTADGLAADPDEAGRVVELAAEPSSLAYGLAGALVLDPLDKQALLATPDDTARLRLLLDLLRRENGLLQHLPSIPGSDYARVPVGLN